MSVAGARIAVVVPAFNEARLIVRTLSAVPEFVDHVVVVDDASADATCVHAASLGDPRVQVIRHRRNRGVGAAIVTGYRAAFAQGAAVCAVMAGDAQMDPHDLLSLLDPVLRGEAAYAKGDRLSFPNARTLMPRPRWLANVVFAKLTSWAAGLPVRDAQCGYTALARDAAQQLPLHKLWHRYGYPNDLLGMLRERALPIREVVVRPVYRDETSDVTLFDALVVIPYVLMRVFVRRVHGALFWNRKAPAIPAVRVGDPELP